MAVHISGALIDGAGIPMSGCHIILKSRVNTSEVVMRTVADVVTGNNGEYSFEAQVGKYCVYLKQWISDDYEYCVGDISVYDDSKPGMLNDFLTALDEGDLKPDVVKRFEELVAQAQLFTFEWNGRTWNAGPASIARLALVMMAAKSDTTRDVMVWGDADNQQVKLAMSELEELAAVMAQAQLDRNDDIYQRQREMKEGLNSLENLGAIRAFTVE